MENTKEDTSAPAFNLQVPALNLTGSKRNSRVNSQGFSDQAMAAIAAANGLLPTSSNNERYPETKQGDMSLQYTETARGVSPRKERASTGGGAMGSVAIQYFSGAQNGNSGGRYTPGSSKNYSNDSPSK